MTGPALYGDPIDPNEQFVESPVLYAPSPSTWSAPPPVFNEDERPGEVVVAAVLGLTVAGLLLITGFVVIFAASSLEPSDGIESTRRATLFVFAGLVNVIAAALLIVGGVLMLGRARSGRATLAAGTLLCIALGIFWLANDQTDSSVFAWLVIFCVPVITATILSTTTRVSRWLVPADGPM